MRKMVSWDLSEDIKDPENDAVNVFVEFDDGTWRILYFDTPKHLDFLLQSMIEPEVGIYGPHLVVLARLTEDAIDMMLKYLEREGDLESISLPYPGLER